MFLDFFFCLTSVTLPFSCAFGNNFEANPFIPAVIEPRDVLEENNFVKPGRFLLYSSVCCVFEYYFISCSLFQGKCFVPHCLAPSIHISWIYAASV